MSNKGSTQILLVVAVLLIAALAIGAFFAKDKIMQIVSPNSGSIASETMKSQTNSQKNNETKVVSPVPAPNQPISQTATNPISNSSDSQLDSDLSGLDAKMGAVSQEQTGIDQGLSQTAPNVQ